MAANWYEDQIQNNNYLSPIGFSFTLEKAPKAAFLCQTVQIPDISIGAVEVPTPFQRYPIDGNFVYGDFSIEFLVDESLENYLELHNWLRPLGVPFGFEERRKYEEEVTTGREQVTNKFSDGTLTVLTNGMNSNFQVVFFDMFPVSLSTLEFDATITDNNFFRARATFRYSMYELRNLSGQRLTAAQWLPGGRGV